MYPKAYLFHENPLEGIEDLITSTVLITFSADEIYRNRDILRMIDLYNASGRYIHPRYVTTIYPYNPEEMLVVILKFNIERYCYLKSEEYLELSDEIIHLNKRLDKAMQNMNGLEKNLRSCYKSLELLRIENASPMSPQEIDSLSNVLLARKMARPKLTQLIQSEFIDCIC